MRRFKVAEPWMLRAPSAVHPDGIPHRAERRCGACPEFWRPFAGSRLEAVVAEWTAPQSHTRVPEKGLALPGRPTCTASAGRGAGHAALPLRGARPCGGDGRGWSPPRRCDGKPPSLPPSHGPPDTPPSTRRGRASVQAWEDPAGCPRAGRTAGLGAGVRAPVPGGPLHPALPSPTPAPLGCARPQGNNKQGALKR